jgi:hypothetical protein
MSCISLTTLSNEQLLLETARLVAAERCATAQLIAYLAEVDRRELYLAQGYSSLFTYCTQALHLSEHAAYDRIRAARLAQQCPLVLERLTSGAVTLATVALLAPHLDADNCERLLDASRHQSKREVERLVAGLAPRPDVTAFVRRLPATRPVAAPAPNTTPATVVAAPVRAVASSSCDDVPALVRDNSLPPPSPRRALGRRRHHERRQPVAAVSRAQCARGRRVLRTSSPRGESTPRPPAALRLTTRYDARHASAPYFAAAALADKGPASADWQRRLVQLSESLVGASG